MAITNEFLNYEGLQTYDNEIRNYINTKKSLVTIVTWKETEEEAVTEESES